MHPDTPKTPTRFLVLGIGTAQVDLLHVLRSMPSIEVHALANSQNGAGRNLVEHFAEIDITDVQAVEAYAVDHNIDIIYSVGSDVAMPTVAAVSETLSLTSFVSPKAARLCNTKHLMRQALAHCYGAVLGQALDHRLDSGDVQFPAIVKPVDGQGQRGVTTVSGPEDLGPAYENAVSHSRSRRVLIEEKIIGTEISVNAFVHDGQVVFACPSSRVAWQGFDGGLIHKHLIPAGLSDAAKKNVNRLVNETLLALGLRNGPAYFQIMLRDDDAFLIEVTPRLDGCHMWRLIEYSTGINLLELTIGALLKAPWKRIPIFTTKPGALEFFCQPPGAPFEHQASSENALDVVYYYEPGEHVRAINGRMDKCGYQILPGSKAK